MAVLSYHPFIVAGENRSCAGRRPDDADAAAMAAADAVILNQGCYESLYRMAVRHCPRVFPNYAARFDAPGKTGQIRLFRRHGARHPGTDIYHGTADYHGGDRATVGLPAVFKFDWGGEGETVYLLRRPDELAACLDRAARYERTGQFGFLIQEYVPHAGRTLRVVVTHRRQAAYWRIQDDADRFGTAVSGGARIDGEADPERVSTAKDRVAEFCARTGVNLAGFDLLFAEGNADDDPYFIEINYFFGRSGLGGAEAFYRLLNASVGEWLADHGLGSVT